MLDLSRKLVDELVIGDNVYEMNLAFNKVLKIIELVNDEDWPDLTKPYITLQILTDVDFSQILSLQEAVDLFKQVFDDHIKLISPKDSAPLLDLAGNPIKGKVRSSAKSKSSDRLFSLKYDADYIYASFLQAYNIDLIEVQNSLHWKKFNALLNGLPSNTKFAEVLKVRAYKPQKGDSKKYIESMKKLKKEYELPADFDY
ncbi:Gp15 family bacteriophage protein [Streptococcus sp. H49]|uniref:Gp15 family bacteriophage protein n=1 Tax=Streptococcus huangxiaojuni TaxID=3237239 RepID=UPI0034A12196